eukprot:2715878-Pyramimonas_sp.AAC.1
MIRSSLRPLTRRPLALEICFESTARNALQSLCLAPPSHRAGRGSVPSHCTLMDLTAASARVVR